MYTAYIYLHSAKMLIEKISAYMRKTKDQFLEEKSDRRTFCCLKKKKHFSDVVLGGRFQDFLYPRNELDEF